VAVPLPTPTTPPVSSTVAIWASELDQTVEDPGRKAPVLSRGKASTRVAAPMGRSMLSGATRTDAIGAMSASVKTSEQERRATRKSRTARGRDGQRAGRGILK
jgi:hypothetical protein